MTTEQKNIKQHYNMLCKEIGTRHLGSKGEIQAANYIQQQFETFGYETQLEYYDAPGWLYHGHQLAITETDEILESFPCFYSHSCDLKGTLTVLQKHDVQNLESLELAGKICLVDLSTDLGGNIKGRNELAEELDQKGVTVAIFISNLNSIYNTKIVRTPNLKQMAVLCVSGNVACQIAQNKDKTFKVNVDAENISYQSPNVVGRIGSGSKKIVIGAHYDTAPYIEGANDNASGTVAILELAKQLSNQSFNHQLEFVAFSGEEYGGMPNGHPIGSYMYAEQHKEELNKINYMVNFDDIGFCLGGLSVYAEGNSAVKDKVSAALESFNMAVDPNYPGSSDERVFLAHDIPSVLLMGTNNQYAKIHTPEDNMQTISIDKTAKAVELGVSIIQALDAGN